MKLIIADTNIFFDIISIGALPFNLLLSRYGMERFLYRLSISPHKNRFILKGASLFLVWKGQNYRVTRDADLLGFGDTVTPAPEEIEYPTLFDSPAPRLRAYPRYTLVSEKLVVMLKLGLANSRMKDFYDIWLLSRLFSFEGDVLRMAIENTFNRRRTPLPVSPFAFTSALYDDPQKQVQWRAFVKKSKPDVQIGGLDSIIRDISEFLSPVIESLKVELPFNNEWLPERGWITRS